MGNALIGYLIYLMIPVIIVVLIIRFTQHASGNNVQAHQLAIKELIIFCLVIAAGYAGIIGLLAMPKNLMDLNSATAEFAFKIIAGVLLVLIGLPFKGITRMFLMIMGIIMLVIALPYVFTNLGSIGAFVLIALAMVGLVAATILLSRRERKSG